MSSKLKLGIIGISDGNGHPYSWSAIFNGYQEDAMARCPFPAIPAYLRERKYPEEFLSQAQVSHIWTQDAAASAHIASASNIPNIASSLTDMLHAVDAVLLARDDAESHYSFAKPCIEAGKPIYIDKPIAHTTKDLDRLLGIQQYAHQIFSCSALLYADELIEAKKELDSFGDIISIQATVPKSWEKYSIHVIDPVLYILGYPPILFNNPQKGKSGSTRLSGQLDSGAFVSFTAFGSASVPIAIEIIGSKRSKTYIFRDAFSAFRTALHQFVEGIDEEKLKISREATRSVVSVIERGLL